MGERKKANTNEQKRKCPQKLMKECRFLIREDTICIPCLLGWKQLALVLSSIHSSVLMLIFPTILSGDHRRHHNRNTLQVQNRRASRCDWYRGGTLLLHQLSAALRRDFLHFFRFGDFNGNHLFDQGGKRVTGARTCQPHFPAWSMIPRYLFIIPLLHSSL